MFDDTDFKEIVKAGLQLGGFLREGIKAFKENSDFGDRADSTVKLFDQISVRGVITNDASDDASNSDMSLDLIEKQGVVIGKGTVGDHDDLYNLEVMGVLIRDNIASINYSGTNGRLLLAGSLMLTMSDCGSKAHGAYVGRGPKTNGVIYGKADLKVAAK